MHKTYKTVRHRLGERGSEIAKHRGEAETIDSFQSAMPTLRKASLSRQFPMRKNVKKREKHQKVANVNQARFYSKIGSFRPGINWQNDRNGHVG